MVPLIDSRFDAVLAELREMHDRKNRDYGSDSDPYANVRASEDFGIPGWVGAVVRAGDKQRRLQAAARGSELANEGIRDSLIDNAVYYIIAAILFDEQAPPKPAPPNPSRPESSRWSPRS